MNKIILHHYDYSPYSEKVRRMLAYAGLDWQSVIHKEMPPRPELSALAGGYLRIPVAQIGADVICDSNLIAEEIAMLANKPELSLFNSPASVRDFVNYAEGKVFFASVLTGGTKTLGKKVRKRMSLWNLFRFMLDRMNMARKASTENMIKLAEARAIVNEFLEEMETRLQDDFLFGSRPNIADFSAYHCLWFMRDLGECHFIANYPKVCAWMDRMSTCGKSNIEEIAAAEALEIANDNEPKLHGVIGTLQQEVAIAPDDYRQNQTKGKLVFEDECRWVLNRSHPKTGSVNIHFPKLDYKKIAL